MPLLKASHHIKYKGSGVTLIALVCIMAGNLWAAPPPADEKALDDMRDKITASSERARIFEEQSKSLDQKINDLRANLVTAAKKIQDAEDDVYSREDRLDVLNVREKDLKKFLKARYGQMAKTLAAMQRLSQQPAEMVAYRPDKAINSLRSASLLKTLQPELKKRAEVIRQDMTELAIVRKEITKERQELREILQALTKEQIEMNQLLAERRQKQKELRRATRAEREKLKQFAAQAKSLKELVDRIKKENIERENAAIAAAKRLKEKPGTEAQPATTDTARLQLDSLPGSNISFHNAKGTIPLPARGSIHRTFGIKTPEGLSSEGITIHTLPRATVVSPHEGRIVFAGKFRSYGQLLIIAHGPEYHTLLAGMTRLDAEVGQWVLKGEPIGQMATEADTTITGVAVAGQNLYVELRRMGKPINLLPWIVARDRKVL